MENKKLKDLLVRTASATVMLLIFVGAVFLSKWSAAALFAVIMIGGLVEFYNLCRQRGYKPMYGFGIISSLLLFVALAGGILYLKVDEALVGGVAALVMLYVMVAVPAIFIYEIWRKSETPIANVATTFMGVLYVGVPMSLLVLIPYLLDLGHKGEWSPWALMAFVSIIWANDVFAYLVGVSCGKHRLCERISPKKSWEGFFGGLIGAVGLAVLFGHLFEGSLVRWGIMGLIAALTGVAGDLVESMFKREVGVKDSGKIMPGHGGFLDRFDALFIAVPFVVIYLSITLFLFV